MARELSPEAKAHLAELVGKVREDRIHRAIMGTRGGSVPPPAPAPGKDDKGPKPPPAKDKPEPAPEPAPKRSRWGMYADDPDDTPSPAAS